MSARPGCPGLLGSPPNRAFPSAPPKARASPQRGAGGGGGGHRGVQPRVQTCLPPPPWCWEWAATQDPEPGCSGLRRPQTNSLGHPACAQPSTSRAGDAAHSTRPPRLARGLRVWRRRGRGPGNGGAAVSPAPGSAPSGTACPGGLVRPSALQAWGGHLALFSGFSCPDVLQPGLCATHREGPVGRKGGEPAGREPRAVGCHRAQPSPKHHPAD